MHRFKPIIGIMFCTCDGFQLRYATPALQESDMASPGTPGVLNRWHSSVYVSEGQAAVELFYRLNHARQTMDYVRRQVSAACARNPNCRSLQRESGAPWCGSCEASSVLWLSASKAECKI